MQKETIIQKYAEICNRELYKNDRAVSFLRKAGIFERFIFDNFNIGYSNGSISALIDQNEELLNMFKKLGILNNGKDIFKHCIIIPILNENKACVNIAGYNIFSQTKNKLLFLNNSGIFNHSFLQKADEIIFTRNPLHSLLLIQHDYPNTTFINGDDQKYVRFLINHHINKAVFTFQGKTRLFYELSKNGISCKRIDIDFNALKNGKSKEYLEKLFLIKDKKEISKDMITKIENGFVFQFPHLNYRIIGNFTEYTMNMRCNIKAYTQDEVFVDSIDLYKNRDRTNFIYNLMDKFNIRDQLQLENDLTQIMDVIEKHRQKQEKEKKKVKPELTDYQKETGLKFLSNPQLIDEIERDFTKLGYVRERKNKLLLYLVMTSRLMDNPLHAILISRSGAGKSWLAEITENMCPCEGLESISDLSAQALYYYGKDDLKHKFIVIGEKQGSEGSDYPLRELISKKSISKALPMKDQVTGQIRTVNIRVNGPISLVETTTSSEINSENLNRCFVVSIDESEEQTRSIHEYQRRNYTLKGYLAKKGLQKIIDKHIYAQRLLKKILVFNPYAEQLTFPSSKLRARRDNEKFLRLISAICFLHQYQRKVNKLKLENNEIVEYIECKPDDYRIAYELLSDGVLDNTLDDLPQQARRLLELIKKYLKEKSEKDNIPTEKIIFERKDIREYTSWSFAQVRNNFRVLRDYEYIQLIKAKNGLANQYRLNGNYSDLDFLNKILSPEELEEKIANL